MERRLKKEYDQAAKEVQEKLSDYLKRYKKKDETWRKWVREGKKTEAEYKAWRKGQLAVGRRWSDLKNQLAKESLKTDQLAKAIINGEMPKIYVLNHAYGTWQVEKSGNINTAYTLYNREAIERIMRENPDMLPPPGPRMEKKIAEGRAVRWSKQKLQSDMIQGILQGDSIPELAQRIAGNVDRRGKADAVRYARTMATGAQNAGRYDAYRRARDLGINLVIEWAATLDNRTRHAHREMHGQRTTVDEPFYTPDGFTIYYPGQGGEDIPQRMIWNCFVGDTNVTTDSEIIRSYKHEYTGELITVETSCGVKFTCTPNHPILTPAGWVPVALLNKGDNLLIASIGDGAGFVGNGNVDHVHSTFHALHDSLQDFGRMEELPMSDFNFHGDIPTSNVEVVSKEGLLWGCFDTGISEGFDKLLLKHSNPLVTCKRHFMAGFRRVYISTLRLMSRRRKALTLFWWRLRHSDVHGLGTVAGGNTGIPQNTVNNLSAMSDIGGKCLDGLAGKVFADNIVSVDRHTGRHIHVYNLQTENGYYFVNNIIGQNEGKSNGNFAIAHNCRCTLLAWVEGFEHETMYESEDVEDFDEWLEGHSESQPIMSQWDTGEAIRMQYTQRYRNG